MMRTFGPRALLVVLLTVLLAAACGSDDSDDAAADTTVTTTEDVDVSAFCHTAAYAQAMGGGPFLDPTVTVEMFNERARTILGNMQAQTPEEVRSEIGVIVDTFTAVMDTMDPTLVENRDFVNADHAVDQYMLDNCEAREVEVAAGDHFFQGIPGEMERGLVAVTVTNDGEQDHEMIVRQDGVPAPVGYVRVHPGQTDTIFMRLAHEGAYQATCTLTDPHHGNVPHNEMGMETTFEVTNT